MVVPHIADLNKSDEFSSCVRTEGDRSIPIMNRMRFPSKVQCTIVRSFARAWRQYIRYRIVSEHAKRIISQFMAACCGKSTTEDPVEEHAGIAPTELEKNEACNFSLQNVHNIIQHASSQKSTSRVEDVDDNDMETYKVSDQIQCSLRLGSALWSFDNISWGEGQVSTKGHYVAEPTSKATASQKEPKNDDVRFQEKVYLKVSQSAVDRWFHKIKNELVKPNQKQLAYLHDIADRCMQEAEELQRAAVSSKKVHTTEPYRKCLLGPPGTGKSECLKWTSRFFEEVLGWTHGVQYQKVAPQHTMAILIGGQTVHSWGCVPINATSMQSRTSKSKGSDIDELFTRCQSLRWLLIDEIEAVAAVVCGILHGNLCRSMSRTPYAKRKDGSQRPFGGLNLSLSGDWWQLPPVMKIGFYSNPFNSDMHYTEQIAMSFFWRKSTDAVQGLHELTESNRTSDPWLKEVLQQDREGQESWEVYCFTHGLPTKNVGSWMPGKNTPNCGKPACLLLSAEWLKDRKQGMTWQARQSKECQTCQTERLRRCCVLYPGGMNDERHMQSPFTHAPYIHPWNAPKYHAQQLRAISFAKSSNLRVHWIVARDWPIPTKDETWTEARVMSMRQQFLRLHDKKTAGIMGLFPAVLNLPVSLTQTEDASIGAVKNARGTLVGWTLPDVENARLQTLADNEVVLEQRPTQLLIKLRNPTRAFTSAYGEGLLTYMHCLHFLISFFFVFRDVEVFVF